MLAATATYIIIIDNHDKNHKISDYDVASYHFLSISISPHVYIYTVQFNQFKFVGK